MADTAFMVITRTCSVLCDTVCILPLYFCSPFTTWDTPEATGGRLQWRDWGWFCILPLQGWHCINLQFWARKFLKLSLLNHKGSVCVARKQAAMMQTCTLPRTSLPSHSYPLAFPEEVPMKSLGDWGNFSHPPTCCHDREVESWFHLVLLPSAHEPCHPCCYIWRGGHPPTSVISELFAVSLLQVLLTLVSALSVTLIYPALLSGIHCMCPEVCNWNLTHRPWQCLSIARCPSIYSHPELIVQKTLKNSRCPLILL